MIGFIDDHREAHGVEPICKVLPIAPSTCHDHVAKPANPERLSMTAESGPRIFAQKGPRLWNGYGW